MLAHRGGHQTIGQAGTEFPQPAWRCNASTHALVIDPQGGQLLVFRPRCRVLKRLLPSRAAVGWGPAAPRAPSPEPRAPGEVAAAPSRTPGAQTSSNGWPGTLRRAPLRRSARPDGAPRKAEASAACVRDETVPHTNRVDSRQRRRRLSPVPLAKAAYGPSEAGAAQERLRRSSSA